MLEEFGIITRGKLPNNKKTNIYRLTEIGLSLAPIVIEFALWGDKYLRESNPNMADGEIIQNMREDKSEFIRLVVANYQNNS